MHRRTRRPALTLTAVAAVAALAACSGSPGPAEGGGGSDAADEPVELRLAWWGADARHAVTQEVIDLFEAEYPHITVVGDFSDWGGYWDRLATATAGGDMPDVMQMDGQYLATYADRGALMDLGAAEGFSAGDIDEAALAAGEIDGTLYGVVNAVNSWAVVTNRTLIEAAGLEMPDDTTWTWDDLAELSVAVTQADVDGAVGLQDYALTQGTIDQFARQQGEDLWTADGELGVSEETLVAYWELALELLESGALPSAAAQTEALGVTQDQSFTATNRAAFGFWWSNQLGALQATSGQDLVLLRPPLDDDGDRGIWYRPSQFWSASASTDHPEEAALLIDFLVNSEAAGEVLLAERGTPANVTVREAVRPLLAEADQAIAEYLDSIADELDGVATLPPAGSADFENTLRRYTSEVYFGSTTPQEAAPAFIAEVQNMLG
ncbi:ABC transporter substrate-binding protein [Actinotalea sp. JY-7885]|uniref:ABC transporter substrate-binding protein n=1 Tax=Actinotalea sp. JY-7885 TaxID=2758576 RepID=UPI00165E60D4|nr:extracellular solute-binding protein [Actinotalea sp. JY-7885]